MQSNQPARRGGRMGEILLRWGLALLGMLALWIGIHVVQEWFDKFGEGLAVRVAFWLVAVLVLFIAGLLLGAALWLPVPGRGGRPAVLLAIGGPLVLMNVVYAVLFHVDLLDLPLFLAGRVFTHPLLSSTAALVAALFLGLVVVASFRPAGYVPLSRLGAPQQYAPQGYERETPASAPPPPSPPL